MGAGGEQKEIQQPFRHKRQCCFINRVGQAADCSPLSDCSEFINAFTISKLNW